MKLIVLIVLLLTLLIGGCSKDPASVSINDVQIEGNIAKIKFTIKANEDLKDPRATIYGYTGDKCVRANQIAKTTGGGDIVLKGMTLILEKELELEEIKDTMSFDVNLMRYVETESYSGQQYATHSSCKIIRK